jgi:hypothetical protein
MEELFGWYGEAEQSVKFRLVKPVSKRWSRFKRGGSLQVGDARPMFSLEIEFPTTPVLQTYCFWACGCETIVKTKLYRCFVGSQKGWLLILAP